MIELILLHGNKRYVNLVDIIQMLTWTDNWSSPHETEIVLPMAVVNEGKRVTHGN
jgi:hypothetical protein